MRGLEIEPRDDARSQVGRAVRGKRLDVEGQDGARTEAGPVRSKGVEIGSRQELADAIQRESSQLEKSGAVIGKVWGKDGASRATSMDKAQQAQRGTHDPYAGDDARQESARDPGAPLQAS